MLLENKKIIEKPEGILLKGEKKKKSIPNKGKKTTNKIELEDELSFD